MLEVAAKDEDGAPVSGTSTSGPTSPHGGGGAGDGGDGGGRHPLDNPARASLLGHHSHLALRQGGVLRYQPDVTPFIALPDEPDDDTWRDAAALLGPGAVLPVAGYDGEPPAGWTLLSRDQGVQLVDDDGAVAAAPDDEAVVLGPRDVPEMLALVSRTRPGPFLPRTIVLGTYLGLRRDGELIAMAGERLHPPGWTEISAVCTDPAYRGQGLATRLVHAIAAIIRDRGETPFMHAAGSNTNAIRLYEQLGFRLRRRVTFTALRVPGEPNTATPPANPLAVIRTVDVPSGRDGATPTATHPTRTVAKAPSAPPQRGGPPAGIASGDPVG